MMSASHLDNLLLPLSGPELVFGIVGPIGVDTTLICNVLAEELKNVRYTPFEIRVTEALSEIDYAFKLEDRPLNIRYDTYIKAGNILREKLGLADAFALMSIAAIRNKRRELVEGQDAPKPYTAYILNKFKRPEEISTLRKIYGRGFIQISAYASINARLSNLTHRIAESNFREKDDDNYKGEAYNLIARDYSEEEVEYGQRVRDTFPMADVIINADSEDSIRASLKRFIRAFFGDNFITPTVDNTEYSQRNRRHCDRRTYLDKSDLS